MFIFRNNKKKIMLIFSIVVDFIYYLMKLIKLNQLTIKNGPNFQFFRYTLLYFCIIFLVTLISLGYFCINFKYSILNYKRTNNLFKILHHLIKDKIK